MGYDWSKQFLVQHAETVSQLTELYNSAGVTAINFADPQALNRVRQRVSNILASLALNFPEQYKDIRDKVRTWTSYSAGKEEWTLFIGAPKHKVTGRKPGLLPVPSYSHPSAHGPAKQSGSPLEVYGKLIEDRESFEDFAKWVATLASGACEVRAELSDPPDNDKFLDMFKRVGWTPQMESPTTIVLRRPKSTP